jgi:hypothetical protein
LEEVMGFFAYRDVSSNGRFMVAVSLDKKRVGTIHAEQIGETGSSEGITMYRYFPKGKKVGGGLFATLNACKRSIEAD